MTTLLKGDKMKPKWMSDEQYAEYRMTEEYKSEVMSRDYEDVPDDEEQFDGSYSDTALDYMYCDAVSE